MQIRNNNGVRGVRGIGRGIRGMGTIAYDWAPGGNCPVPEAIVRGGQEIAAQQAAQQCIAQANTGQSWVCTLAMLLAGVALISKLGKR